uniref:Putative secreted peptide n=1 Tax=Anopheles braziliensis TaxID=58242 RepID=A0A2M3ZV03_9DIPT
MTPTAGVASAAIVYTPSGAHTVELLARRLICAGLAPQRPVPRDYGHPSTLGTSGEVCPLHRAPQPVICQ